MNQLSRLISDRDWSTTAVGPEKDWPASLRTVLRIMLSSRYAMWLGWGKDLTFFYNDEYAAQTLGAKHPWALGQSARAVWAEIWKEIGPRIDHVLATGEATWDEGLLLFLERSGYSEETYHTFSYSRAPNDDGSIGGLFCVVIEQTAQVIGERRLRILRELGELLAIAKTRGDALRVQETLLARHAIDFPFSMTYFVEAGIPRRVATTNIDLDVHELWPIAEVLEKNTPIVVPLDAERTWPATKWGKTPTQAIVVPLPASVGGVFIAGLSPYRALDADTRSFAELFANQLGAGISSGLAYEREKLRAEELAELDRAKTAFFSNISHEFRTPLTLMLGPTEDALAKPERALVGEELEIVHRNELRLLKLVNTLLDFARAEAGRVQAAYEPTDLGALTRDLASSFRSAMERAGLKYTVECPTLAEPIYVDHDMWEKIVLNLLSNALKFTLAGEIRIALRMSDSAAELTVSDTGGGIPEHELPRMFERFHRIEGLEARTHEGSGIGLALVRDLVRLHGGEIRVASDVRNGSTFTVTIPRGMAHLPPEGVVSPRARRTSGSTAFVAEAMRWLPEDSQTPPAPPSTSAPRVRILVADDNADMREYVERLLRDHWHVTTARDGADALAKLEAEAFDLIVADVMMPRIDGFELAKKIRANGHLATTPIVLLSARAGEEAIADGLRAGADDYLTKPFSASTLLVRIEAQLAARSRAALRQQIESERERLRAMFEVTPSAVALMTGPELSVEIANPKMLELWGTSADVIGLPFQRALPELHDQPFGGLLREVVETGLPSTGKAVLMRIDRRRDGNLHDAYFDFSYAPVHDADGALSGVFVHAFEVTELVNAQRAAESANRMKDEFLATMSHELRTPLNAILGWATLLRTREYDLASRHKALETIERNAKSQSRLIDDVLDVSRITSGKLRLNLRNVDIAHVLDAALDVVRPAAAAKGIRLEITVASDNLHVAGDADRLQQVIWNLLSNAVRFTPANGSIRVDARREGGSLRVTVVDSGSGIPEEHLPYVFERFRQVDSSTTRLHGGLGLGLAIVRHLVELHGGTVMAESAGKDRGATFTVHLPIRAVAVTAPTDVPRTPELTRSQVPPRGALAHLRVLVVDDDDDSRTIVATALGGAGATVTPVGSAQAALAAIAHGEFDVVVSDIGMPSEDGYSLIRKVRAANNAVPALALTAYARRDDETLALAAGFQRHLTKPVDPELLALTVAELASASATQQAG